jgi:NitT/TauT family transport system permease protein
MRINNKVFSFVSIIVLFVVWQFYSIKVNNEILMPYPKDVVKSLINILSNIESYKVILYSVFRVIFALSISFVLGTIFGMISGLNEKAMFALKPIITSIRTLPVISIIIVVLIIFGNNITLYIVILLLLFPIIYQSVLDGVKNIDSLLLDALKLEADFTNFNSFKLVYFPLSIPHIKTALIDSIGLGFKVLVVAEYIAQTNLSIGKTIYMHKVNLEFSDVFAWTLMLLVFVLLFEWIVEKTLKGEH